MTTSKVFNAGTYAEIDELMYHSGAFGPPGGSLSSTGAKRILEAPAVYRWHQLNQEPPKTIYDFGHIVHAEVLGVGLDVVEIPEEYLASNGAASTKLAKDFMADARANGDIPVKPGELEEPRAVAAAVLADPLARTYFEQGTPEQSIFAQDPETGVWMRGRLDWTKQDGTLVDLKTTASNASQAEFSREAAKLEYGVQREFYRHIWTQITGEIDPDFVHVVVSKKPPYLVGVYTLDIEFELIGQAKVRRALDTYKECLDTGVWPGYAPELATVGPPAYYVYAEEDEEEMEVN